MNARELAELPLHPKVPPRTPDVPVSVSRERIVALSRTAGNHAVTQLLSGRRLQRLLSEDVVELAPIKIWENDEIKTVYFAGHHDKGAVKFTREQPPSASKTKGKALKKEFIDPKFAFDNKKKDKEIIAEIEQMQQVSESGVKAAPGVVEYVTKRIQSHADADELAVQITPHRILSVLAEDETTKEMLGSLKDLQDLLDDEESGDYYVVELIDALKGTGVQKTQPASSADGGGGGKSGDEWKSKKMKRDKGEILAALMGSPGFEKISQKSTLHHKISRDALGRMYKTLAKADNATSGVREMRTFVGKVEGLTSKHGEEALDNWAANIELGVIADARAEGDDPGSGFDGSYPQGASTPRTEKLEEAALVIDTIDVAKAPDWLGLAALLNEVQARHGNVVPADPSTLSRPNLTQWTLKSDGTYVRDKKKKATA